MVTHTDTHTHRQTDRQTDYCNPPPTWARVNYGFSLNYCLFLPPTGQVWTNMIFEIPSSFQMGTVCFFMCAATFLFHVLQCSVLLLFYGHLLSMDSYMAATTDDELKTMQSYIDAWPVSLQLVEFHSSKDQSPPAKNDPATATRLTKCECSVSYSSQICDK